MPIPDAAEVARTRVAPTDHDLTVIVPAYNEEKRLPGTLAELRKSLDAWRLDYRVLVADDASTDRTATLADSLGKRFSTVSLAAHAGKGRAVRTAMLRATGRVLAFTDADLPYEVSSLRAGYEKIRAAQCQVVFGARDVPGSTSIAPRRLSRKLATCVFRQVVRYVVSREVTDTQCGLKLFSRRAALEIFSRATIDGFAFDTEIVLLCHHLGLSFQRVPVTLIHEYDSSLSVGRHAIPMLLEVVRLWLRSRPGRQPPNWRPGSLSWHGLEDEPERRKAA
jgi:dolichyl-phosphate beta-glucosyltransferase